MKNLIITCITVCLGFLGFDGSAQVERTQPTQTPTQMERDRQRQDDKNRTSITQDQLPMSVRTTLSSDRYNTWQVSEAWKVTKDDKTYYEVRSSRGNNNETFKFDENGRLVDDKKKMRNRQ